MKTEVSLQNLRTRVAEATNVWLGLCVVAAAACTGADPARVVQSAMPALEEGLEPCEEISATASLRDASGVGVGQITFTSDGESTYVEVSAHLPAGQGGIHGMHIHANDKPENGEGHGHHEGDLPPLYFTEAGEASMRFLIDHLHVEDLVGRAVIVHAGSDNYGNIPIGDGPDQYTPNSGAATDATAKTGNAGPRIACGVIE